MGSCYSLPAFLYNRENEYMKCIICWENVDKENIHIKCGKCKIYLHYSCAQIYKQNNKNIVLSCPHCKRLLSIFIYDNNIYDCKPL